MLHAARLVKQAGATSRVVVVVSAMRALTDRLLTLAQLVDSGISPKAKRNADSVLRLQPTCFLTANSYELDHQRVWTTFACLAAICCTKFPRLRESAAKPLHDSLASFGERFSARLFAAALDACEVPPFR